MIDKMQWLGDLTINFDKTNDTVTVKSSIFEYTGNTVTEAISVLYDGIGNLDSLDIKYDNGELK